MAKNKKCAVCRKKSLIGKQRLYCGSCAPVVIKILVGLRSKYHKLKKQRCCYAQSPYCLNKQNRENKLKGARNPKIGCVNKYAFCNYKPENCPYLKKEVK
jgi:hypothetical protein